MIKTSLTKLNNYSLFLMVLTSVHHVYGAYVYHTTWRLHVLFVSVPTIIIILAFSRYFQKTDNFRRNIRYWFYWSYILLIAVLSLGVFEGLYNHVLKNILFFCGANRSVLMMFFPSPTYEMPNDFFFELTGILQGVIAVIMIVHFIRLTMLVNKQIIFKKS